MLINETKVSLDVNGSPMNVFVFEPAAKAAATQFPGIIVFTEIYQVTGPVKRLCKTLAGDGYVVISPESYHEFVSDGALPYNEEGTDLGNELKKKKSTNAYDADARACISYLQSRGIQRIGTIGMCLGGHLATRCALEPEVSAAVSFFATDIHDHGLGSDNGPDNTLASLKKIRGEIIFIWGRQDNHVDDAGRLLIKGELDKANVNYTWLELNAQHAFIRDEMSKGRYDPAIAKCCMGFARELFHRKLVLGLGDTRGLKGISAGPERC